MTPEIVLTNLQLFAVPILITVGVLLAYMWFESGMTIAGLKKYLNTVGRKVLFGLTMAATLPALIGIVLSVVSFGTKADTTSPEWRYLDHTIIMAGLEVPMFEKSFTCAEKGVNNRLTSNLSVYQQIAGAYGIDYYGYYLHHSCAINEDVKTSDSIGFAIVWRIDWK